MHLTLKIDSMLPSELYKMKGTDWLLCSAKIIVIGSKNHATLSSSMRLSSNRS